MKILNEIKGAFKPPIKKYYLGKIAYGAPYFYPFKFNSTIISCRKLKLRTKEQQEEYIKGKPWLKKSDHYKFTNLPIVRRTKEKIIKIFNTYYFFQIGFPISIKFVELGWKDKWDCPRFEWCPQFHIFFFKWQFCIFWVSPDENHDRYWEMVLWYLYYSDKNIEKAEKTWGWVDFETNQSTWNNKFLIK